MKGYKWVCQKRDGTLFSASHNAFPTEYKEGEKTKPAKGCGPLVCFKTKQEAEDFNSVGTDWTGRPILYEVEYTKSRSKKLWRPERKGDYYARNGIKVMDSGLPNGTVFCSSITLLRKVD